MARAFSSGWRSNCKGMANGLLKTLTGKLLKWAKAGGGWVVLALLESKATGAAVKAELKGKDIRAGDEGIGCKALGEELAAQVIAPE